MIDAWGYRGGSGVLLEDAMAWPRENAKDHDEDVTVHHARRDVANAAAVTGGWMNEFAVEMERDKCERVGCSACLCVKVAIKKGCLRGTFSVCSNELV